MIASMIEIKPGLSIPEDELAFSFSRSGGPGGQNVNKVETRVALLFDVNGSPRLSPEEKRLVRSRLATRTSKKGVLRVVSQKHRTQAANREEAVERFIVLLRGALKVTPPRRRTRVSRAARERRLAEKKRRGRRKRERSKGFLRDE